MNTQETNTTVQATEETIVKARKINMPAEFDLKLESINTSVSELETEISTEMQEYLDTLEKQLDLRVNSLNTHNTETMLVPTELYKKGLLNIENNKAYTAENAEMERAITIYKANEQKAKVYINQQKTQYENRINELESKLSLVQPRVKALKTQTTADVLNYLDSVFTGKLPYVPEKIKQIIMEANLPNDQTIKNRKTRTQNNTNANQQVMNNLR